jgi:uncharacterized protein (DUF4415 family)
MAGNKRVIGSDLAKIDAHVITPEEYEEIPELTDAFFETADVYIGGKLVSKGRPRPEASKQQITLSFDKDIIDRFRASGPGWQSRINEALRNALP